MIDHSENIVNIAAALLSAQKEIGVALKNEKNPYFKSNYADLKAVIEAVKDPLNNHGITFLQAIDMNGEQSAIIETMLLHESGQFLCSRTPVYCAKPNDPQAFGSGVTYSKRYALQAFMGLPTADDDAEGAMARNSKKTPPNGSQKPETKTPKMTSKDILEKAFQEFQTANFGDLADGFIFDKGKFKAAVLKEFKKLPTVESSVPLILEKIKTVDCITEMKK